MNGNSVGRMGFIMGFLWASSRTSSSIWADGDAKFSQQRGILIAVHELE